MNLYFTELSRSVHIGGRDVSFEGKQGVRETFPIEKGLLKEKSFKNAQALVIVLLWLRS